MKTAALELSAQDYGTHSASRSGNRRKGTVQWIARHCLSSVFALLAVVAHAEDLQVGQPVPKLDTELISGKTLVARQLEGKVVLHYFWATWCPICRSDLPKLQQLYKVYNPRGLEIVAQSLDDDPSAVREYWREGGFTFPVAMRSDETREGFGPIKGTPTYFLVGRSGKVNIKHLGTLPDGALERHIKELLK